MNIEFNSQEELYNRVLPALKSKVMEFKRKKYDNISEIDIWKYLAKEVFPNTNNLTLSDIVSYIMHVDINEILENKE